MDCHDIYPKRTLIDFENNNNNNMVTADLIFLPRFFQSLGGPDPLTFTLYSPTNRLTFYLICEIT